MLTKESLASKILTNQQRCVFLRRDFSGETCSFLQAQRLGIVLSNFPYLAPYYHALFVLSASCDLGAATTPLHSFFPRTLHSVSRGMSFEDWNEERVAHDDHSRTDYEVLIEESAGSMIQSEYTAGTVQSEQTRAANRARMKSRRGSVH
jgi:hypothetical protein